MSAKKSISKVDKTGNSRKGIGGRKAGGKKTGGRKKGTPNKNTSDLKNAILEAAEKVGLDGQGTDGLTGYCSRLALKEPKAFATLLGKVMPLQIANADDESFEVIGRIERVVVEPKPNN